MGGDRRALVAPRLRRLAVRLLRFLDGLFEPVLEAPLAESRVVIGNQRTLAKFRPEVPRVRVNDNLARVVLCAEALTDQLIETELLGPSNFDRAVQWRRTKVNSTLSSVFSDMSLG